MLFRYLSSPLQLRRIEFNEDDASKFPHAIVTYASHCFHVAAPTQHFLLHGTQSTLRFVRYSAAFRSHSSIHPSIFFFFLLLQRLSFAESARHLLS